MYISAALPMATIKTQSKMKTSCKYAVSCCNVNFVTLHLVCLWHLFLLHQQECTQLQGLKKNQEKKMQHAGFTEWNHSSGLQGLDFFYIFVLLCFSATLSIGMLSS